MSPTAADLLAELAALDDPKARAVNERHGDDHGVNLSKLRAIAKRVKPDHELAKELWASGNTAGQLLSLLLARPKLFTQTELDAMLREARSPKVRDWLLAYVVKKSPHTEAMRLAWWDDADPLLRAASWDLTADRVAKDATGLDLPGLLDVIEEGMASAPDRLQWTMNTTLAQIGIHHPALRARALRIGESLGVLKDYPTPKGCVSPYAPLWISEMVRRAARDEIVADLPRAVTHRSPKGG